jgi:endonuclease/exonuclease/phosphatase family metal-dependent hydrolase
MMVKRQGAFELKPFTVMSFNIHRPRLFDFRYRWKDRRDSVLQTIVDISPDLLGLQEANCAQTTFLAESLSGYDHVYHGRANRWGTFGLACPIFYKRKRYFAERGGTFWFNDDSSKPGGYGMERRTATWLTLDDKESDRKMLFMSLQMPTFYGARYRATMQLSRWFRSVAPLCENVVVVGDFSDLPGSETHEAVKLIGLRDAQEEVRYPDISYRCGTKHDFTGRANCHRQDWVMVGDECNVTFCDSHMSRKLGRWPSSHHPVVAKVEWT